MRKQNLKALGQKIKTLRKKKEWKQIDLAVRLGISSSYVGSIEQGLRHPSLRVLERISRVLKIPLKELFDF